MIAGWQCEVVEGYNGANDWVKNPGGTLVLLCKTSVSETE